MAAQKKKTVECPGCGAAQPDQGPSAEYTCMKCGGFFDATPDEGGSYFNDPTKRIENADEKRHRKQSRLGTNRR